MTLIIMHPKKDFSMLFFPTTLTGNWMNLWCKVCYKFLLISKMNIFKSLAWHEMGYWHAPTKLTPSKTVTSQVQKFLTTPSPQTFNPPPPVLKCFTPPLTEKKQDVKLMHKPLIQLNCQQKNKKQRKSEEIYTYTI